MPGPVSPPGCCFFFGSWCDSTGAACGEQAPFHFAGSAEGAGASANRNIHRRGAETQRKPKRGHRVLWPLERSSAWVAEMAEGAEAHRPRGIGSRSQLFRGETCFRVPRALAGANKRSQLRGEGADRETETQRKNKQKSRDLPRTPRERSASALSAFSARQPRERSQSRKIRIAPFALVFLCVSVSLR
jgi:hypothetical protein